MKPISLGRANIDNLTQLWKLMGAQAMTVSETNTLYASTSWPYRLWYDWVDNPGVGDSRALIQNRHKNFKSYCIPTWGNRSDTLRFALESNTFTCLFKQTAMVLDLAHYKPAALNKLRMIRVQSAQECQVWTDVASQSFGYPIDSTVTKNIVNVGGLQLLILIHNDIPIASSMLFSTGDVIGIHLVGVLPSYRDRGFARQLMQYLLNECKASACHYATLQASNMGESLYRQLGFIDQFEIINYTAIS